MRLSAWNEELGYSRLDRLPWACLMNRLPKHHKGYASSPRSEFYDHGIGHTRSVCVEIPQGHLDQLSGGVFPGFRGILRCFGYVHPIFRPPSRIGLRKMGWLQLKDPYTELRTRVAVHSKPSINSSLLPTNSAGGLSL